MTMRTVLVEAGAGCLATRLFECPPASLPDSPSPICQPASLPANLPANLRACLPACLPACQPSNLPVGPPACGPACLPECLNDSLPAQLLARLLACPLADLPAHLPTGSQTHAQSVTKLTEARSHGTHMIIVTCSRPSVSPHAPRAEAPAMKTVTCKVPKNSCLS